MKAHRKMFSAVLLAFGLLAASACYGTGSAYVGVYGPGMYGPSAWGAYPYAGRYPPVGGTVWIGTPRCCEEDGQEEQQEDGPTEPESAATDSEKLDADESQEAHRVPKESASGL